MDYTVNLSKVIIIIIYYNLLKKSQLKHMYYIKIPTVRVCMYVCIMSVFLAERITLFGALVLSRLGLPLPHQWRNCNNQILRSRIFRTPFFAQSEPSERKIYMMGKLYKKAALCAQHGSVTSRPFRKSWLTDRSTKRPISRPTDRQAFKKVTFSRTIIILKRTYSFSDGFIQLIGQELWTGLSPFRSPIEKPYWKP